MLIGPRLRVRPGPSRWMQRLDAVLRSAEIDVPAREFAVRFALVGACLAIVGDLSAGVAGVLLAVILSSGAVAFYLRARAFRRMQRFSDGLYDMLILISSSLKAGHSFVQAIHVVSCDMDGPIQEEFVRMESEMQMGIGTEEALQRANERIASEDFDLVVTAISIQRQVGGNLAEVIDKIAETIRERVQLKREVKALTSQGRMSALIFMVLPGGVAGILFMIDPSYLMVLFQTPVGLAMVFTAVIGQVIGYYFIRRIVNVEL